jgi:hypothetical protein
VADVSLTVGVSGSSEAIAALGAVDKAVDQVSMNAMKVAKVEVGTLGRQFQALPPILNQTAMQADRAAISAARGSASTRELAASMAAASGAGGPLASLMMRLASGGSDAAGGVNALSSALRAMPLVALGAAVAALVKNTVDLAVAMRDVRKIQTDAGMGQESWFATVMNTQVNAGNTGGVGGMAQRLNPAYWAGRMMGYGGTSIQQDASPTAGVDVSAARTQLAADLARQLQESTDPAAIVRNQMNAGAPIRTMDQYRSALENAKDSLLTPEERTANVDKSLGDFFGDLDKNAVSVRKEQADAAEAEVRAKERILELTERTDELSALKLERELQQLKDAGAGEDLIGQLRNAGYDAIAKAAASRGGRDSQFAGSLVAGTREEYSARIGAGAADLARDTARNTADTASFTKQLKDSVDALLAGGAQVVLVGGA